MKLTRLEIKNFRSISECAIEFSEYSCFLGQNGAGKSTVLNALNIFFRQNENTQTNLLSLQREDFHNNNISEPILIRITFTNLSPEAQRDFSHYYRDGQLIITAQADFDVALGRAEVRHFGERMVFGEFAKFFQLDASGSKVAELNSIYDDLREKFGLPSAPSKAAKIEALRAFEAQHPHLLQAIPSSDQFYGVSRGANKLEKYVQWVFVPAVKDPSQEQTENQKGALTKLLARAVRAKTNFDDRISEIRKKAEEEYAKLLDEHKPALSALANSLNDSIAEWAHQGVKLDLSWQAEQGRSVRIEEPFAGVSITEGQFCGQLSRLGHGLQRSYIIALLQNLALFEIENAPTLILAIEEPELYQHPPQARHLAELLARISETGSQVIICTHSPYFVLGGLFENVFLVKKDAEAGACQLSRATPAGVAKRIGDALQKPYQTPKATRAKLHQLLQPQVAELFFAPKVVLVEGREDIAYIKTFLDLEGCWPFMRSKGFHFIAVDKKSEILRPLVICQELKIDVYAIFDADGDEQNAHRRRSHEIDNLALLRALSVMGPDPFPEKSVIHDRFTVWESNIGSVVKEAVGDKDWLAAKQATAAAFEFGASMQKNVLFIADLLSTLHAGGVRPKPLCDLVDRLLNFAKD